MAPPVQRRFKKKCFICGTLFGPITSLEAARRVTCSKTCRNALNPRSNRTRYIEHLYWSNPNRTYADIAREVGCSREWVRVVLTRG